MEKETPQETLLAQVCNDLLAAGTAHMPPESHGLDVTEWAALAQEASTRLQRPVEIKKNDRVLMARIMDWPATSSELAVSMQQIRRTIEDLGGAVHVTP